MMWNDGVIEDYQRSIFSSIWLRYIIVSATGRPAPISRQAGHPAGQQAVRLEAGRRAGWAAGRVGCNCLQRASDDCCCSATLPRLLLHNNKIWENLGSQGEGVAIVGGRRNAGNANGSSARKSQPYTANINTRRLSYFVSFFENVKRRISKTVVLIWINSSYVSVVEQK